MAKACASQGALNTGPSMSRGRLGSSRSSDGSARATAAQSTGGRVFAGTSARLEVRFPAVDIHGRRSGVLSPEIGGFESHRVQPLRLFPGSESIAVGKHVRPMHVHDRSRLATTIARQPGVGRRIDIERAYMIADREARLARERPLT